MIDRPTISLLLCRDKNNVEAESTLPTVEEIEHDFQQMQERDEQEVGE